jgi:hypothetical protein
MLGSGLNCARVVEFSHGLPVYKNTMSESGEGAVNEAPRRTCGRCAGGARARVSVFITRGN